MYINLLNDHNNPDKIEAIKHSNANVLIYDEARYHVVLLKGNGDALLNFEKFQFSNTHIIFLCPGEVLEVFANETLISIGFDQYSKIKMSEGFCYSFGNTTKVFELDLVIFDKLETIAHEIKNFNYTDQNTSKESPVVLLERIFKESPKYLGVKESYSSDLIFEFTCLVHEHHTMRHDMDYYAKLLKTSAKRVTQKFNEVGVENPHSFIKKRIIIEIKRQLLYTDKTIKSICFDTGFNDPSYFSRFFKKNVGMTAKQFRVSFHRK